MSEQQPPERIWINYPTANTEHDQPWYYENEMAFPTVEYARVHALASEPDSIVPQTCAECGHEAGWLGSSTKTCQKPLVDRFPGIQICGCHCVFLARAGEGEAIDRGAARIAIDSLKVKIGSSGSRGYLERVTFNDALEQALLAIEGLTNQGDKEPR